MIAKNFLYLIIFILLSSFIYATDFTDGLMLNINFDENVLDNSGRNNHGTLINGSGYSPYGYLKNATYFNDSLKTYVIINNSLTDDFDAKAAITINFWMNGTTTGDIGRRLIHMNGVWSVWWRNSAGDEEIRFRVYNSTGGTAEIEANQPVPSGTWQMITVTYSSNNFSFYYNGTLIRSATGLIGNIRNLSVPVYVGIDEDTVTYIYRGFMDEVSIWNYSMNSTQITELYNLYQSGETPVTEDDCITPVQASIPYTISGNNNTICSGTYYLNASSSNGLFRMSDNSEINMSGAIFIGNSTGYVVYVNGNNATIRGIGNIDNYNRGIYVAYGKDNITITNNTMTGGTAGNQKIYLEASEDTSIYNNYLSNSSRLIGGYSEHRLKVYNNILVNASLRSIETGGNNPEIYNNTFYGTNHHIYYGTGTGLKVYDNYIESGANISQHTIYLTTTSNINITRNIFVQPSNTSSYYKYAIRTEASVKDMLIYNNTFISTEGFLLSGNNTQIYNNYYTGKSFGTSSYPQVVGGQNNTFYNNRFFDTTHQTYIIGTTVSAYNNTWWNNVSKFYGTNFVDDGVQTFYLRTQGATNVLIENNTMTFNDRGIIIFDSKNVLIRGNAIRDMYSNADVWSVALQTGQNSSNITIINNTIVNWTTAGILVGRSKNINITGNYLDPLGIADRNTLRLTYNPNYGVDMQPPHAVQINILFKSWAVDGENMGHEDSTGLNTSASCYHNNGTNCLNYTNYFYEWQSINISIFNNTFGSNVQGIIWNEGASGLTHNIPNTTYWYRKWQFPAWLLPETEMYYSNNFETLNYTTYINGINSTRGNYIPAIGSYTDTPNIFYYGTITPTKNWTKFENNGWVYTSPYTDDGTYTSLKVWSSTGEFTHFSLKNVTGGGYIVSNVTQYNLTVWNNAKIYATEYLNYSNCTTPVNNLEINESTTLCSGTYYLNDTENNGTIIIKKYANNLVLDCNGAVIIGNNYGKGVYASDGIYHDNITIQNCNFQNYTQNYYFIRFYNLKILNNTGVNSVTENIYFARAKNVTISGNYLNNAYNSTDYAHGIYISGPDTDNITVNNNNIYNSAANGIHINSVSTNAVTGVKIYYNSIINSSFSISDMACQNCLIYNNTLINAVNYLFRPSHDVTMTTYAPVNVSFYNNYLIGGGYGDITIRDATRTYKIYNNTYGNNYSIINIRAQSATNYSDGYIEEYNLTNLTFDYTSSTLSPNAKIIFNYSGKYLFRYNNTVVDILALTHPYNDIFNISTSSLLASNVDNYSITLSNGQQIIVGNYVSDSCTYTSGNWNINISDNCIINSPVTVTGILRVYGTSGVLTINSTIIAEGVAYEPSVFNGGFIIRRLSNSIVSVLV